MSDGYSYFTDPGQDLFLYLDNQGAERDQRNWERIAQDPNFMGNLAQYSLMYPTGSAELGLAIAQGGIPASDPMAQQFVQDELLISPTLGSTEKAGGGLWDSIAGVWDEAIDDPVKGAVRWGFAAWQAAYDMTAGGAAARAGQLADQTGVSYGEAWKAQDPYFLEALGGLAAGEKVNLGSGWFPHSNVAPDVQESVNREMEIVERNTAALPANEKYTARLEASPQVWRDAVAGSLAQQELGSPIVQQNWADTESVMFDVQQFGGDKVKTPWSPGRMIAANFVEPGTQPFTAISASGDFNSQVFLDPMNFAGAW